MAKRSIRARVRAGRLEPLEPLPLPEGSEVEVTLDVPEPSPRPSALGDLPVRRLGIKESITREDIYDDAG